MKKQNKTTSYDSLKYPNSVGKNYNSILGGACMALIYTPISIAHKQMCVICVYELFNAKYGISPNESLLRFVYVCMLWLKTVILDC